MSVIIIREEGAKPIDQNLLRSSLAKFDGWGITYFQDGELKHTRHRTMSNFIEIYKQKETQDLRMVVHLLESWTGDPCLSNVQPKHIFGDVGVLSVDGYTNNHPPNIEEFFEDGNMKSDDTVVAEMFRLHCAANADFKPIANWNRFLSENEKYLKNVAMVLMLPDGSILNKEPEKGYYEDKGRLWFSEELEPVDDEPLNKSQQKSLALEMHELIPRLEEWKLVYMENLAGLSKEEMTYLCVHHSHQIAQLMKTGCVGYARKDDTVLHRVFDEIVECFDCEDEVDMDTAIAIDHVGKIKYICSTCVKINGD